MDDEEFIKYGFNYKIIDHTKSKPTRGEKRIYKCLWRMEIPFIFQHVFIDCKYKDYLWFDFYLPDHEMIIEYQGQQHYKPVKKFGGIRAFRKQQIKDEIKRNYCENNHISMIEIAYWDYKNIETILEYMLCLK
jgi:hypothetical protein